MGLLLPLPFPADQTEEQEGIAREHPRREEKGVEKRQDNTGQIHDGEEHQGGFNALGHGAGAPDLWSWGWADADAYR